MQGRWWNGTLLKLRACSPFMLFILHFHSDLHFGHKLIVCDFDSSISNLCFCQIKSYHSHNTKFNWPFEMTNPTWGSSTLEGLLKILINCWSWMDRRPITNCSSLELNITIDTPTLQWTFYKNYLVSRTTILDTKRRGCKNLLIILDQNIIPLEGEHESWEKIW